MFSVIRVGATASLLLFVACHSCDRSRPPEDDRRPLAAEGARLPSDFAAELAERKKQLPSFVFHVTQEEGTGATVPQRLLEQPLAGIYVDVVVG